jgi:hypothetical protein
MSERTKVSPTNTANITARDTSSDGATARPNQIPRVSSPQGLQGVDTAITGLQDALVTEMSGVIDRLVTGAVSEADAALKRAREAQSALDDVRAELDAQTRAKDALAISMLDAENEIERLRAEVQSERDRANTARQECEDERAALTRAQAACGAAESGRLQMVSMYEARLSALQSELDAASAERAKLFSVLQTELAAASTERAKLFSVLQSVQQTVAATTPDPLASRPSEAQSHQQVAHGHDIPDRLPPSAPARASVPPEPVEALGLGETQPGEGDAKTLSGTGATRSLKLVPPSQLAPLDAPPQLVEHVKQLLDEIEAMYWADLDSTELPADVVARLTENLRYAWDVFTRRMASDGGSGATAFEQQLSALLDATASTSFGRHLSIAAHEIVARTETAAGTGRAAAS